MAVVLLVAIIAAILVIFFVLSSGSISGIGGSGSVDVTAVNITSSDNACGSNGHTFPGFTLNTRQSYQQTFTINNGNLVFSCTINSVSTTTPGFSVSGANTPLTIPADGSESLSFTVTAPGASYNGVLTLDLE